MARGDAGGLARHASALEMLAETTPRMRELGLYVHVPFCTTRCPFCSFNTAPMDDPAMARYLGALAREVDLVGEASWAADVELVSVFLGGGTPSLLRPADLAEILTRVRSRFALRGDAEITVECNPESLPATKSAAYRAAGVTRISLGVQALDDSILPVLGREHSARTARDAFDGARAAGFESVSVDLMYGVPGLDVDGWTRAITAVLDWGPDHLSAYGLTLDEGSVWGARGVSGLPPEDTVVAQYWALARQAAARGYEHYEVSNYARPGFRSRHNQIYWHAAEYLACGPGACGFVGDVRYSNARALPRYCGALESGTLPVDGAERLTPGQRRAERLILGLRTVDGVPRAWLEERLGGDAALRGRVRAWIDGGFLLVEGTGRVRLTE
ncbi:MAG: radical SAM family heme chaperone HemW, partial [Candidatus Rokuibacteriota bacterium]